MTQQEYEVISVILEREFAENAEQIIISCQVNREKYTNWIDLFKFLCNRLPGIEEATVQDFATKDLEDDSLKELFTLSIPTALLTTVEGEEIFKSGGWKEFYRRYPNSRGINSVSQVGFNNERTQALACVGIQAGRLMGHGRFFLLVKESEGWRIEGSTGAWVS